MELLTFVLISIGFIIIPGPNVLITLSTSVSHGMKRGIQTVAGIGLAMIVQLCVAAIGTAWFVATLTQGLLLLKWCGVGYLVYLGISQIVRAVSAETSQKQISGLGSFQRGFWVSLTNPKTILFFSAFLPQFAVNPSSYFSQIVLLSSIFWVLGTSLNCLYVLLASKLRTLLDRKQFSRYQDGVSGCLYLGAGAALAASENG